MECVDYPYIETVKVKGRDVKVYSDYELTNDELLGYANLGYEKFGDNLRHVEVCATEDPDFVDVKCAPMEVRPFERIRRITGYLSSVDHFNNAKIAELNDRVKHGLS